MDNFDPNEPFPMVFQQISVKESVCNEYGFPEEVFHRSGVGLHVIYYRSDEGRLDYEAWCYVKSIPLMRLVGVASLDIDSPSLEAANKLVTDHILNDELLPARCQTFLGWIESEDDL